MNIRNRIIEALNNGRTIRRNTPTSIISYTKQTDGRVWCVRHFGMDSMRDEYISMETAVTRLMRNKKQIVFQ